MYVRSVLTILLLGTWYNLAIIAQIFKEEYKIAKRYVYNCVLVARCTIFTIIRFTNQNYT